MKVDTARCVLSTLRLPTPTDIALALQHGSSLPHRRESRNGDTHGFLDSRLCENDLK